MKRSKSTLVISVRIRSEAEVKAEALREAVAAIDSGASPRDSTLLAGWLARRANRIEKGRCLHSSARVWQLADEMVECPDCFEVIR